MEKREKILRLLLSKEELSDSEQLRKKIFIYSVAEGLLILLLLGFSFFLFRIMVG